MGGGGKGGGGGGETPQFVREGTRDLANRSQQLFDLSRPLLETGTSQIADLIRTGGPGANVPIINQAVAAQRGATQRAQAEISGDFRRAGLEGRVPGVPGGTGQTPFASRMREQLQRIGDTQAARIPTRAAAPLISSAATSALGGAGAAGTGFQGALGAISTASRVGQQAEAQAAAARRSRGLQLGRNLFNLASFGADRGFFDFLQRGGGGGGAAAAPSFGGGSVFNTLQRPS